MFADNLLKNRLNIKPNLSCATFVVLAAVIAAIGLKLAQWFLPAPEIPLLVQADGLVTSTDAQQAQATAGHAILMPEDLQGSDVYLFGVYTQAQESTPAGTVVVVLSKDDWRFAEVVEQPGVALDDALKAYGPLRQEDVAIAESISGKLIDRALGYVKCVHGHDGIPGACQLTKSLVFALSDTLITISADDSHATDGELIAIARSMISSQ
jgi:hypothetical protein